MSRQGSSAVGAGARASAGNSTAVDIAGSATYTGTWERVDVYASISIMCSTSGTAQLFADFSQDGSTQHRAIELSRTDATDQGIHSFVPVARYFRVRLVDTSTATNTPALQVMFNSSPRIALPTSRREQAVGDHSDVLNTRNVGDFNFDIARGKLTGLSDVHIKGYNGDVSAGVEEDIWGGGGAYPFQSAAVALRIKVGGNAADTAAGLGAQSVIVEGLDANWESQSSTIVTAGASASTATTETYIRVNRAYVADVGAYGVANTGAIIIETTGDAEQAHIDALRGESQNAAFTVPASCTGYLWQIRGWVDSSKTADILMYQRQNADDASTPFQGRRVMHHFPAVSAETELSHDFPTVLPAKTDVWMSCIGPTGGGAAAGEFEISLEVV